MDESLEAIKVHEIEILSSMYSDDFRLDDPSTLLDLQSTILAQESSSNPSQHRYNNSIRFSLKLISPENRNIEATFDLPASYPSEPPCLSIRCSSIENRAESSKLSSDLHTHLRENIPKGEPVVLEVVQWLLANVETYIQASIQHHKQQSISEVVKKVDEVMARYWIYSHHIYNTAKRKIILETARWFKLTGFSAPGKPGIVCVEGDRSACEAFWQKIKGLTWKKISIKHQELQEDTSALKASSSPPTSLSSPTSLAAPSLSSPSTPPTTWRKFDKFEEKVFPSASTYGHSNMGLLRQFLQDKQCQHIFQIYLGISETKDSKT